MPAAGQNCTIHPEYSAEFAVPQELNTPGRGCTDIEVAVSAHMNAAGTDYDDVELGSVVSEPIPLRIIPDMPDLTTQVDFGSLTAVAASPPKILDNRSVAQARFDLTDTDLMSGHPFVPLSTGTYTLYRCSEDVLRLALIEQPHTGSDDPTPDVIKQLTATQLYKAIEHRLIRDWEDEAFSLKFAFAPVDLANLDWPHRDHQNWPHFVRTMTG
jgi:hypothetical protein